MGTTTYLWQVYTMALDDVTARLNRICAALAEHSVPDRHDQSRAGRPGAARRAARELARRLAELLSEAGG